MKLFDRDSFETELVKNQKAEKIAQKAALLMIFDNKNIISKKSLKYVKLTLNLLVNFVYIFLNNFIHKNKIFKNIIIFDNFFSLFIHIHFIKVLFTMSNYIQYIT